MDHLYNNEISVPDWMAHVRHWGIQSERARQIGRRSVISYGSHPLNNCDVYEPEPCDCPAALLVFLHGGYWYRGDKDANAFVAPAFTRSGITVALPNYRLGPEASLAEMNADVGSSIRWLKANIYDARSYTGGIWLAGHSAGAHLAALQCTEAFADPATTDHIRGSVLISGLYALEQLSQCDFLRGKVLLSNDQVEKYSPAKLTPKNGKQHLAAVGACETAAFGYQRAVLRESWSASVVTSVDVANSNHFGVLEEFANPHGEFHRSVLDHIGRVKPL